MFSFPTYKWAVTTTVFVALSLLVAEGIPSYSPQCTNLGVAAIESADEAVSLCAAASSTPATPQSGAENTAAFAAVTGALSLLGGIRDYDPVSDLIVWKWYEPSTNAGEIYWASPTDANEDGTHQQVPLHPGGLVSRTVPLSMAPTSPSSSPKSDGSSPIYRYPPA